MPKSWSAARVIAFGIVGALSSVCHPEERSDEGSAAAFQPISGTTAQVRHRGSREKQPQILHYVQDDKRWTSKNLRYDCPGGASRFFGSDGPGSILFRKPKRAEREARDYSANSHHCVGTLAAATSSLI
jgi:hypothetical protein